MAKKFPADEIVGQLYWEAYYSDNKPRPPHELWESVLSRLNYRKRCLLNPEKERETILWRGLFPTYNVNNAQD